MSETLIQGGEYADLAIDAAGVVYVATETPARDAIAVYRGSSGQQLIAQLEGDRVWDPDRGWLTLALYPRIASSPDGRLAVIYQRGPCVCVAFVGIKDVLWSEYDVPFGAEMAGIAWMGGRGRWRSAAVVQFGGRGGPIRIVTMDYTPDGLLVDRTERPTDTTQGISRIDAGGVVWLNDEENRWPPFGENLLSRPWRAGDLVVGQGNDAPARALGYFNGDTTKPYRIFDGLAFRPRAVQTSSGWTVIAGAAPNGVRVVDVPPFVPDVAAPPPPPPPEEEVKPPKITVRDYPRVIRRDGTYDRPLVFEDGNGQVFTVTLDGWSTRIEGRDKDGKGDKTGQKRTVRVEEEPEQAADPSEPVERIGQSTDEAMAQSAAAEEENQS